MKTKLLLILALACLYGCQSLPPADSLPEIGVSPILALAVIEPDDIEGRKPIPYGSRPSQLRFGWEAWQLPYDMTEIDRRLVVTDNPSRLINSLALSGPQRVAMYSRWRELRAWRAMQ